MDGLQACHQGKEHIERNDLGKDKRHLHHHSPARGISTIIRS